MKPYNIYDIISILSYPMKYDIEVMNNRNLEIAYEYSKLSWDELQVLLERAI